MTVHPTVAFNQELINRFKDEPAPLLPILHAFHDRDGFLSEDAIRAVSKGLRIPIADLYGTDGAFVHRKGTRLSSRTPRLGVAAK